MKSPDTPEPKGLMKQKSKTEKPKAENNIPGCQYVRTVKSLCMKPKVE